MKKLLTPFVFIIIIVVAISIGISITMNASASTALDTPPPPPTPGAFPTDMPHFLPNSTPIKTHEDAIITALAFDNLWTARTKEVNESAISVEYYATRQEVADKYDLGVFVDKQDALDPTWVVVFSGEVSANSLARIGEMELVNGVIYMFSATDGNIVAQINGLP